MILGQYLYDTFVTETCPESSVFFHTTINHFIHGLKVFQMCFGELQVGRHKPFAQNILAPPTQLKKVAFPGHLVTKAKVT